MFRVIMQWCMLVEHALTMHPLVQPVVCALEGGAHEAGGEEAVARGAVTVTEVSDGGHVPELLVSNTESQPGLVK